MSDGGKGSSPRPFSVSQEEYDNRWNTIFRRDGLDDKKKFEEAILKNEYYDEEDKTPSRVSSVGSES